MQFIAKARYIRYSPYKLRPIADVVRGKNAQYALNWLATCALKKADPVRKTIQSAVANAKDRQKIEPGQLAIKEIRVDQGPSFRYYKSASLGRSGIYKRRFSHISVVLEPINKKEKA